jgi:hypothetical protein
VQDYFEITTRPISLIVDANQSKIYGDSDPELTFSFSEALIGSDTYSGVLSRESGQNVGFYEIYQGSVMLPNNYNVTFVPADFEIITKDITVTVDPNQTKSYGDLDPELTYTPNSSIASWDSFTGSLEREVGENLGFYEITQGTLALNSNYNLSFVGDDFEIVARPITINADAGQNKTYGDSDPAEFTYYITGTLVGGDNFTGSLSREAGEDVGLYEITLGDLALNANYNLEYVPADFEIIKATPVITWENPADIYNNEALSATQLNATSDVEGSFTYNPDFGAFLSVGDNQELTCSFTPTDALNYNTAEKTVYINVLLWVGLEEIDNSELSVYPNPSHGKVSFEVKNQNITNIIICAINGKVVANNIKENCIDLTDIAPGVYIAKISTENNTYFTRIVKQ